MEPTQGKPGWAACRLKDPGLPECQKQARAGTHVPGQEWKPPVRPQGLSGARFSEMLLQKKAWRGAILGAPSAFLFFFFFF